MPLMIDELQTGTGEQLTIDLKKANVYVLISLIPITLIYALPFYLIWNNRMSLTNFKTSLEALQSSILGLPSSVLIFAALIIGIVIHEFLHGITWSLFAKRGFKSISFGVMWKMLTPYCHCSEPLKVKHYIIGAIMPAVVLGIAPAIISLIIGNILLLAMGILFTVVAMGDFMIINLLRNENKNDFVKDHPSEAGCYIYRSQNN